jgi:hypothetical protein
MRKLLLAGVAVLLMGISAAHAKDQLPKHMLGRWCYDYIISTKSLKVYFRPDHKERTCCCSDMTDGITISQEGYDDDSPADDAPSCLFDKIDQENRDTYLVHMRCREGEENPYHSSATQFQIVNGLLFVKWGSDA